MTESLGEPALVSIIVPVFNAEAFLRESLDSIIAQSYRPVEVLVMDDASTDGSPAIVAAYGDKVKYYRQPRNRGIYGNVNDGIAMCRGEYIAAYHADDVYHPNIVEQEVAFLQRYPEAGAVFCMDIFTNALGQEFGRLSLPAEVQGGRPIPYPVILNALLKYKNAFLCCPTAMVRASVHRDVGVYRDEQFRNTSDLDMWLRIARKYPLGIIPEYLLRYRRGHNSSSERYRRLRLEPERFFLIMDQNSSDGGQALANHDALAAYEAHRAEDRLMLVVNHYILNRAEEARAILRQVRPPQILGSGRVQRDRLTVLFLMLQVLVRLPRIPLVAGLFQRHWYDTGDKTRRRAAGRLSSAGSGVQH